MQRSIRRTVFTVACLCLVGCLSGCTSTNQSSFAGLEAHEREKGGDWATSLPSFEGLFAKEIERLGRQTYVDLPVFIGTSLTRHYWCSSFLEDMEGLESDPLRQRYAFALLILQQGIVLAREHGTPDEIMDAKATKVSMNYRAAILAEKLGLHALAAQHKASVQSIVAKDKIFRGALPVRSREDRALYDAIE